MDFEEIKKRNFAVQKRYVELFDTENNHLEERVSLTLPPLKRASV